MCMCVCVCMEELGQLGKKKLEMKVERPMPESDMNMPDVLLIVKILREILDYFRISKIHLFTKFMCICVCIHTHTFWLT